MSKIIIMIFLDEFPDIKFKATDIRNAIGGNLQMTNIHRALRTIIKREEYECIEVLNKKTNHKVRLYGRT